MYVEKQQRLEKRKENRKKQKGVSATHKEKTLKDIYAGAHIASHLVKCLQRKGSVSERQFNGPLCMEEEG